jgi:hypothetical protein
MLAYLVTAVLAFATGFVIAALLRTGRAQDHLRGDDLLVAAVDQFVAGLAGARVDADGNVHVPREQLDRLRQALSVRDELHAV